MEQKTKTDWVLFVLSIFVVCSIVGYALYLLKAPDENSKPFTMIHNASQNKNKQGKSVIKGQNYTNSTFGYSFVYPTSWDNKPVNNNGVALTNISNCIKGDACMANIITVTPVKIAPDMPVSGYLASLPKTGINKKTVTLNLTGADVVGYSYAIEGESEQVREYYIKPAGKEYIIVVFQEGYPAEAQELVNSLTY